MTTNILAHTQTLALLENGMVPCIGRVRTSGTYFGEDKVAHNIVTVEMFYDSKGVSDYFFFNDNLLRFHCIQPDREKFILDNYKNITKIEGCTYTWFLAVAVENYVAWKMGLTED